ncbi:MAG TPA: serine/threonine-protein kinase [Gemmataceae bacterium]|jgi:serine/threonine protein kinase|nr:serine/threonine-protein kinase [Gemmataceae bacterium]
MAANSIACPSLGDLERLLAEELRGAERDSVEAHVEVCPPCQEQLSRLSAPSFHSVISAGEGASSEVEPDDGFLHRLRGLFSQTADAQNHRPLSGADVARFPDRRLGRYEILEKLATGGMGAVYKARHIELGKIVAVKVLPAGDQGELSLARFKNEMRAIGRLDHPHIVAAHDAGDADGVHYLAMDLVDGVDLARLVQKHGPLPLPAACAAVRQAALGLQHAFEKGLVHRDIKPSNLMLARGGIVQVLDLGLARASDEPPSERLTSQGAMLGTADYLAPEQWDRPQGVDVRADVYGLGCTLYHLLAGRPPFAGGRYTTMMAKMRAHHDETPPPIDQAVPGVPPELVAVLDRMLAKDPADRFATPADVAEALRPFADESSLVRLANASDGSRLSTPESAVTPGPALLETSAKTGRRQRTPTRQRVAIVAAFGVGLLLLASCLIWKPSKKRSLAVTDMQVTHYRDDGKTLMGNLRTSTADIRVKDAVAVAADFNRPAYCYLIAFNPAGSASGVEQLCYPEGDNEEGARAVKPDEKSGLRYPRDDGLFRVDATGLQVFVLAASSQPLPPYKEWRTGAGAPPWTGGKVDSASRWYSDGLDFVRLPSTRGDRIGAPKPLLELRDWFKGRPEFESVQIFAFPVVD